MVRLTRFANHSASHRCVGGVLSLTEATMGVGIIGLGCLFGVIARVSQASGYQKQQMRELAAQHKAMVALLTAQHTEFMGIIRPARK